MFENKRNVIQYVSQHEALSVRLWMSEERIQNYFTVFMEYSFLLLLLYYTVMVYNVVVFVIPASSEIL